MFEIQIISDWQSSGELLFAWLCAHSGEKQEKKNIHSVSIGAIVHSWNFELYKKIIKLSGTSCFWLLAQLQWHRIRRFLSSKDASLIKFSCQVLGGNMMGDSSRGPRGGHRTSQLEAKPRTVDLFIFRRMSVLGNGVMVLVQMTHITTFVKEVSK